MEDKSTIKISLSNIMLIVIMALLVISLCVIYYFGFIQNNKKITKLSDEKKSLQNQITSLQENIYKNEVKEVEDNTNNTNTLTREEAINIAQDIYNKAYKELAEGSGLQSNNVEITVGRQDTVGGVLNVNAYKLDFSGIEQYFTERAINYIKTEYTDTPYAHEDGNYYIYESENKYSYEKKDFIRTIFGVTDQNNRKLNVKLYDDNIIVAISEKSSFFELDEYLILKKVNNTWKIDMFEEL